MKLYSLLILTKKTKKSKEVGNIQHFTSHTWAVPVGCRRVCQALIILIVYARIEREMLKVFISF